MISESQLLNCKYRKILLLYNYVSLQEKCKPDMENMQK